MVLALLGAGVASDRLDRRAVLIAGDCCAWARWRRWPRSRWPGVSSCGTCSPCRSSPASARRSSSLLHGDRSAGRAPGGPAARERTEGAGRAARHPLRGTGAGRSHHRGAGRRRRVRARRRHLRRIAGRADRPARPNTCRQCRFRQAAAVLRPERGSDGPECGSRPRVPASPSTSRPTRRCSRSPRATAAWPCT